MPEMEMADMEAQFKARMDAHAKALEKALSDEFLEKKRKAEQELEVEIELKTWKTHERTGRRNQRGGGCKASQASQFGCSVVRTDATG